MRLTKFIGAVLLGLAASLCARAQFSANGQSNVTITLGPGNSWVGTVGQGGVWNVTATQPTGSNFHIVCDSGCGGASSFGDNAAFTAGSTPINVTGGWYSASATNCTSGSACAPQLTIDRKMYVQDFQGTSPWVVSGTVTTTPPANASTNITQLNSVALGSPSNYGTSPGAVSVAGVNAFVTNTVPVTGTFWQATQPVSGTFWQTTQPVSGTVAATQSTSPWIDNITQFGGANLSTGTGLGGAGIPRVTVSSDSFPATQTVNGTVAISALPGVKIANSPLQPVPVWNQAPMQVYAMVNGVLVPVQVVQGQAAMAQSLPVTIAANQSGIPVNSTALSASLGLAPNGTTQPIAVDQNGVQFTRAVGIPLAPCNPVRTTNCQHF
jgi:hypothetical protein